MCKMSESEKVNPQELEYTPSTSKCTTTDKVKGHFHHRKQRRITGISLNVLIGGGPTAGRNAALL